jgi:UDP-N-acetylglucosamine/UDP-N-acetylgalactosamine diphosphorylase
MCDPLFLGYHSLQESQFSSKATRKRSPDEKVGVFVRRGGAATVIEYSDLTEDLRQKRASDGNLVFGAGNIAVHVLSRVFVDSLTQNEGLSLPFHQARKRIEGFESGVGDRVFEGIKFESFIFDAMPLAKRICVLLVPRSEEFSPIKNPSGDDSPESSARDQVRLHADWLEAAGVEVQRNADGHPVATIEIGPLFAMSGRQLSRRKLPPRVTTSDVLLDLP